MRLAILGKPQAGKTTVFYAAAGQQVAVGDFSKAVHRAAVKVPDDRVDVLTELVNPKKTTYAEFELLDAPGLTGKGKESGVRKVNEMRLLAIRSLDPLVEAGSRDQAAPGLDG